MGLANLFNMPESDEDFLVWSFSNQEQHAAIVSAIATQRKIFLNLFPMDPMPMHDLLAWAEIHQEQHNLENAVLGIAGVDLTDINFRDPGQLSAWLRLHGNEHMRAAAILGIT